jgi:hypothetical protein
MDFLFNILYYNIPSGEGSDRLKRRLKSEGKFDVHSYYEVLRGSNVVSSHGRVFDALGHQKRYILHVDSSIGVYI